MEAVKAAPKMKNRYPLAVALQVRPRGGNVWVIKMLGGPTMLPEHEIGFVNINAYDLMRNRKLTVNFSPTTGSSQCTPAGPDGADEFRVVVYSRGPSDRVPLFVSETFVLARQAPLPPNATSTQRKKAKRIVPMAEVAPFVTATAYAAFHKKRGPCTSYFIEFIVDGKELDDADESTARLRNYLNYVYQYHTRASRVYASTSNAKRDIDTTSNHIDSCRKSINEMYVTYTTALQKRKRLCEEYREDHYRAAKKQRVALKKLANKFH